MDLPYKGKSMVVYNTLRPAGRIPPVKDTQDGW